MKPTFEKTLDILVKAYLNDTLVHGDCAACAVGNIIADRLGCKVVPDGWGGRWERNLLEVFPVWDNVFSTNGYTQRTSPDEYKGWAKKQIDSTGYTWRELADIECAFESADSGESDDEWMFNGLMAVVDVLAEIHGIDLEKKEAAKALFVK